MVVFMDHRSPTNCVVRILPLSIAHRFFVMNRVRLGSLAKNCFWLRRKAGIATLRPS